MKETVLLRFIKDNCYEVITVLVFLFLSFVIPRPTFDWWSYVTWAGYIREYGLGNIYLIPIVNYLPLSILTLHVWQVVVSLLDITFHEGVHLIKLYPMFFDCLSALLAIRIAKFFRYEPTLAVIALLPNLAFHYNSFIWGQFDSVYAFFVLLTMFALARKKYFLAVVALLLGLNIKLQTIFFLPVIFLLAIYTKSELRNKISARHTGRVALQVVVIAAVQLVILLPFLFHHSPVEILTLVFHRWSTSKDFLTFNAYNWWILSGATSMQTTTTSRWLLGITYSTWGYALFLVSSGIALLPLFWATLTKIMLQWKVWRGKSAVLSNQQVFEYAVLTAYICTMNMFFFLPQMHERYAHAAVLLSAVLFLISRKPWILVCTSIAYVMNLEHVNHFWFFTSRLEQVFPFESTTAGLYFIALLYSYYWLAARTKGELLLDKQT